GEGPERRPRGPPPGGVGGEGERGGERNPARGATDPPQPTPAASGQQQYSQSKQDHTRQCGAAEALTKPERGPHHRQQRSASAGDRSAASGAETMPEAAATNAVATIGSSLSFKSVFQPAWKAAAASTARKMKRSMACRSWRGWWVGGGRAQRGFGAC